VNDGSRLHLGERRLAGAPISWGVCEVPGWGEIPDRDTVLVEMEELGLEGAELGAPGFLPDDASELAALLRRHNLHLVGSFQPLVLHEADADEAIRIATTALDLLEKARGDTLVAAVVQDMGWSTPEPLGDDGWHRLAEHAAEIEALTNARGITFALHSHVGTLIENDTQVQRALAETTVGWCLDTGHLAIGGTSPARFAAEHGDRVTHIHLKDVEGQLAAKVRDGRLSLLDATKRGLFCPLGRGVAEVRATLEALDEHRYDGWLVLEQDTALTADEPEARNTPMLAARQSLAFLGELALTASRGARTAAREGLESDGESARRCDV
jgi:inosose dehydratase